MPDFIIGGAPRSGTTWLYRVLDMHPDIFMAKPAKPEPKFFITADLFAQGLPAYAKWFEDAREGQVVGEKTTNYLEFECSSKRIHDSLPDIKLIFILRDPIERAWSNYLWSRMNGLETMRFEDACTQEAERERRYPPNLSVARPHSYISRGMYADLLAPYFTLFGAPRILVLSFEDIEGDPGGLTSRVHRFLDVPPRPEDGLMLAQVNKSDNDDGLRLDARTRAFLANVYREPNARLGRLLGCQAPRWSHA